MATPQTVKTSNRHMAQNRIRNIGIIAHIDAGKTTTTERILYFTGKSYKIGEVHEGAAIMDWMEQERERGITIVSAATTTFWTPELDTAMPHEPFRINIIDTPGHVDFTAEVERSLRVLDGGITVLDADKGVQSQSETVWRQADKYKVPRICFVNKMDKVGANYNFVVNDIRQKFGVKPAAMVLPMGAEGEFRGLILLLDMKAVYWKDQEPETDYEIIPIPEQFQAEAEAMRHTLVEQICETDEALLEKYFNGEEISVNELKVRACAKPSLTTSWCRCLPDLPCATWAFSLCWTRWLSTCPLRKTSSKSPVPIRAITTRSRPQVGAGRKAGHAGFQDPDRSARWPHYLLSYLFRQAVGRFLSVQRHPRSQRARWPRPADARQPARRN